MRTRLLYIILLLGISTGTFAQHNEFQKLRDTFLAAMKQKPNLTAYLDGRRSFVNSKAVNVLGAFIGYSYGRRVDVGLGYYQTAFATKYELKINKGTPLEMTGTRLINFNYLAGKVDYTFYKTKHWEFSVPLSLGVGEGLIIDSLPNKNSNTRITIIPLETGISGIYLFYDWFGFSSGLSYRLNLTHWQYFNDFSAMNYTFGFSIRFGTLWRHVKKGPKHWYNGCRSSCCLF